MRFKRAGLGRRPRVGAAAGLAFALLVTAAGCSSDSGDQGGGEDTRARHEKPSSSPSPSPGTSWDTSPGSIAALGDSITVAFHACLPLSDCPEASWVTGTDPRVDSLARRLIDNPAGKTWNHAASGAVVGDLPAQAAKAVVDKPELATVLIGANDACADTTASMTSVEEFERDLRQSVRTLREGSPKTQILMVSVPDVLRMYQVGQSHKAAVDVWKLGICQALLRAPESRSAADEARRAQVDKRVRAYNEVLREVCADDARCRYDNGVVHRYPFAEAELSEWDWFHPSKRGQQVLARVLHKTVTARG
ncbi:GDSL-type esterase/lipase family protein [Streptomyces sp. XM4193]|uniref:SGNH/GDSL hydrolase family protein n=1 Tax=Streptomyces sp. XM4193 TaxID=2929782 RepID=UPI001FFA904B|nr:SGNH/GDSL hydrolase family protein [Streptomyces sp. XM4193]MCK1795806.1 GDSL-type esterase/lipase family protein [Streptomyces sp. XM4193]